LIPAENIATWRAIEDKKTDNQSDPKKLDQVIEIFRTIVEDMENKDTKND
jgi:hypothetical protein